MGNSRSQSCRPSRPMYLFYLIQRAWTGKAERTDKTDGKETVDRESELSSSSRCSDCKTCHYRQDGLTFDSESEMAPNAEEELVAVKPWGPQPEKERLRPPTYNAEDYAIALRRWGRRPVVTSSHESHGTLPSTTSSSSGYASGCGEMTLRQFTSVSELLNKLRADLRLAFPSFVQEFASPPADGMTLLLETLRGVQLIQSSPPSGQGGPRVGTRRAALDELGCVECLAACGERCPDAPRLLSQAQPGLLALAVCLTSSLNRSRVLALQLLTKVCQAPGGHLAVSEAVSTLRLRYGEGGRFRFLAGALLAPRAATALRVAGVSFLNAFLKSASRTQTRLYIQTEACEAGLEPRTLQSWLNEIDPRSDDSLADILRSEIDKWSRNCVDVEALQKRLARAEETCTILGTKLGILQAQLDRANMENTREARIELTPRADSASIGNEHKIGIRGSVSSNADDEGISSSERSSNHDQQRQMQQQQHETTTRQTESEKIGCNENDCETTIDDVIEELRIIVKDAEEEFEDRQGKTILNDYSQIINDFAFIPNENKTTISRISVESADRETLTISVNDTDRESSCYIERNDNDSAVTRKLSSLYAEQIAKSTKDDGSKIIIKNTEFEDAIVPAILYPQPPRRPPPCLGALLTNGQTDFLDTTIVCREKSHDNVEIETETPDDDDDDDDDVDADDADDDDGSDSLLSASRLDYTTSNHKQSALPIESMNLTKNLMNPVAIVDSKESKNLQKYPRTIRNYDKNEVMKNLSDDEPAIGYLRACEELDRARLGNDRVNGKMMKRSMSQDSLSRERMMIVDSGKSRIEGRIRKFESLSDNMDNSALRNFEKITIIGRYDGATSSHDDDLTRKTRIKRSESLRGVRIDVKSKSKRDNDLRDGCNDAGSIDDYDLVPLVNRKNLTDFVKKFGNLTTKSLEKIDEGLDTSFDETIFSKKRPQSSRDVSSIGDCGKSMKSSNNERSGSRCKSEGLTNFGRKFNDPTMNTRMIDERCNDDGKSRLLRSDELYDDPGRSVGQWNCRNEILDYRRIHDSPIGAMIIGGKHRCGSGGEKFFDKFAKNSDGSGVFLSTGRYDAFGLAKNRCNVGKYSGNTGQSSSDKNNDIVGVRRNSTSSMIAKRGKVTDILSGLY